LPPWPKSSRTPAEPADGGVIDVVKRRIVRHPLSQTETGRHTRKSLRSVHSTLGHVVDRLAIIEGRSAHGSRPAGARRRKRRGTSSAPAPRLPSRSRRNRSRNCRIGRVAEPFRPPPREFQAAPIQLPALAAAAPKAISEILDQHASANRAPRSSRACRPITARTGNTSFRAGAVAVGAHCRNPKARSAKLPRARASKAATSNFIAAARRAAQAAAAAPPVDKPARGPLKDPARDKAQVTIDGSIDGHLQDFARCWLAPAW